MILFISQLVKPLDISIPSRSETHLRILPKKVHLKFQIVYTASTTNDELNTATLHSLLLSNVSQHGRKMPEIVRTRYEGTFT